MLPLRFSGHLTPQGPVQDNVPGPHDNHGTDHIWPVCGSWGQDWLAWRHHSTGLHLPSRHGGSVTPWDEGASWSSPPKSLGH